MPVTPSETPVAGARAGADGRKVRAQRSLQATAASAKVLVLELDAEVRISRLGRQRPPTHHTKNPDVQRCTVWGSVRPSSSPRRRSYGAAPAPNPRRHGGRQGWPAPCLRGGRAGMGRLTDSGRGRYKSVQCAQAERRRRAATSPINATPASARLPGAETVPPWPSSRPPAGPLYRAYTEMCDSPGTLLPLLRKVMA